MPWKVIYFLCIVLAFALFAGFNMHNACNVSLLFYTIENVPVYVINLFSFLVGIILTVPFFWGNKNRKKSIKQIQNSVSAESEVLGIKKVDLKPQKQFRFWNKKKTSNSSAAGETFPVSE